MDTFLPYLIVCPMVFMAGLIDAVAGGGGLCGVLSAGLRPERARGGPGQSDESALGAGMRWKR